LKTKRKDYFEPYWQDEKDWLCTIEFLPTDDPEARLYGADIIGYLVGYANLTNTRSLALLGDPDAGAYELPAAEQVRLPSGLLDAPLARKNLFARGQRFIAANSVWRQAFVAGHQKKSGQGGRSDGQVSTCGSGPHQYRLLPPFGPCGYSFSSAFVAFEPWSVMPSRSDRCFREASLERFAAAEP
jgi:hypothetical protein